MRFFQLFNVLDISCWNISFVGINAHLIRLLFIEIVIILNYLHDLLLFIDVAFNFCLLIIWIRCLFVVINFHIVIQQIRQISIDNFYWFLLWFLYITKKSLKRNQSLILIWTEYLCKFIYQRENVVALLRLLLLLLLSHTFYLSRVFVIKWCQ